MNMIQTELGQGNARLITWLPQDSRVKIGSIISLHKSTERWKVLRQSLPFDSNSIQRGWKVGGLQ